MAARQEKNMIDWTHYTDAYSVPIWIHPDDDGGFWVDSPVLPGMGTQGETIDECRERAVEALRGLIESYRADGLSIPWCERAATPEGAIERHVIVDMTNDKGE